LLEPIRAFVQNMRAMREHLAQADKLYYKYQKEAWFVDAVEIYCDAASELARHLQTADVASQGLRAFCDYLTQYTTSPGFVSLVSETKNVKDILAGVQYCVILKDNHVRVKKYEGEADYNAEVENTFDKFKQMMAKDYRMTFAWYPNMNHVEAQILDFVAKLYPDVFSELDAFCERNRNYMDDGLIIFEREIQFYIAYVEYMQRFRMAGLPFCYPQVSATSKTVYDVDAFDAALAHVLVSEGKRVVCNDFSLHDQERIVVVTGPNQGGKTTFARTFGQVHYLASLGCPVPGRRARLFLFDHLFTHFEREENLLDFSGKLQDELLRMKKILDVATSDSIVIINEIFSSTTLQDAIFLGKKLMEKIIERDLLCVCVTFIDEFAAMGETVVSMVSTVVPDDPTRRTYKLVRQPANGIAYALSLAEKYGLTYEQLKERIGS